MKTSSINLGSLLLLFILTGNIISPTNTPNTTPTSQTMPKTNQQNVSFSTYLYDHFNNPSESEDIEPLLHLANTNDSNTDSNNDQLMAENITDDSLDDDITHFRFEPYSNDTEDRRILASIDTGVHNSLLLKI